MSVDRETDGNLSCRFHSLSHAALLIDSTDTQLMELFTARRGEVSEAAFGELVQRHGPLVLRACRDILQNDHDAMDSFQATFLILLRKADSLWIRGSLAPWLHRIACRVAIRVKAEEQRRRTLRRQLAEVALRCPPAAESRDHAAGLQEEIDRLPEPCRLPLVLCDLQALTYEEAARQLGWTPGKVKSRLAEGRRKLRRRLTRSGLTYAPAMFSLSTPRISEGSLATLPADLATRVIAASSASISDGLALEQISPAVTKLADGILKSMSFTQLVRVSGMILFLGVLGPGIALLAQSREHEPAGSINREHTAVASSIEIGEVLRGLRQREASIKALSVESTISGVTHSFDHPDIPVRLMRKETTTVETSGRSRCEVDGQGFTIRDGKAVIRPFKAISVFDGKLCYSLRGETEPLVGLITSNRYDMNRTLDPMELVTRYYDVPISQVIEERHGKIIRHDVYDGRDVVVVETEPVLKEQNWKMQFLIAPSLSFAVVKRSQWIQFPPHESWIEFTHIDCHDYRKLTGDIWLPERAAMISTDPTKENARTGSPPRLSWDWKIQNQKWEVNPKLADDVFKLNFPRGAQVEDQSKGRSKIHSVK